MGESGERTKWEIKVKSRRMAATGKRNEMKVDFSLSIFI
jgi:hypothetical protein